ncbi:ECF RNA polymerase sigma factor SigK [Dyadobacter sp. CECT 9623]|uniref:ECF RNA polymerase sigma factor SigK n=1 Tax=Dyadobacter linearis TaxID=2823330 RepID=A0ABN7R6G0_9BACT|nr:RNA polymerase sigma factor [Dyadobacter sp. CECT 9623]CAG5069646.1 ECF RNA polymerase sigma factor SigK [Dyadobacter sp. CECT 9623]
MTTKKANVFKKAKYAEHQLVHLLKSNNREAFEFLYDNYSPSLYGVILKVVKSEETAADVLQDTFLKIWKNIDTYHSEKGTLFTWILNVARNTAIDKLRVEVKSEKLVKLHSIDEEVYASLSFSPAHITMDLKTIVEGLLPERQALIDLVYFQGYTHEEAAEYLCLPLGTVKSRIRKALQELREVFAVQNLNLNAA